MTIYYVDTAAADDTGAGTSEATAWKTLDKVNNSSFNPGDSVLLKSGCAWLGALNIPSSGTNDDPIIFSSYGSEASPVISSAWFFVPANWTKTAGKTNCYEASFPNMGELDLIWASTWGTVFEWASWLAKKASIADVDATQGSCFYDPSADILYIHTSDSSSPILNGRNYCLPLYFSSISTEGKNYINIESIDFQFPCNQGLRTFYMLAPQYTGSSHINIANVTGTGTSHNVFAILGSYITLNNCIANLANGDNGAFVIADVGPVTQVAPTTDITLNNCSTGVNSYSASAVKLESIAPLERITVNNFLCDGTFDSAFCNWFDETGNDITLNGMEITGSVNYAVQVKEGSDYVIRNVRNTGVGAVATCGMLISEITNGEVYSNNIVGANIGLQISGASNGIIVHNNLFRDTVAAGINIELGTNLGIYNNIISGGAGGIGIQILATPAGSNTNKIKNNILVGMTNGFNSGGVAYLADYNVEFGTTYWGTGIDLATYRALGLDIHSFIADPTFRSTIDFHLLPTSPCIGAGTDVGLTTDFDGMTVPHPARATPSIGAYEAYGGGGGMKMGLEMGL